MNAVPTIADVAAEVADLLSRPGDVSIVLSDAGFPPQATISASVEVAQRSIRTALTHRRREPTPDDADQVAQQILLRATSLAVIAGLLIGKRWTRDAREGAAR